MKRAMTILLCVVLLLSAVPMASAADDNYGISVLAATNDEGGITATVVLDNYSNLKSLGFYLSFDSEKLEYKAHNVSGFLSKAMGVVPNVTHGSFNIASLGMNAYSGSNETILTVEFGIKEGVTGACEFNLSNFNFATTTGDIKTASGTHTAGLYLGNTIVLDTSSVEPVKYKSPAGAVTGDGVSVVSAEWKPHVSYPGTFEAGTTYELILKLTAKEGYSFNTDTKVSVNKGPIKENSTTYDAEEKVLTTIVQFTTAAQTITDVDVTGGTNITIPDLDTESADTGTFALTLKDGETTVENYTAVKWDVSFDEAAVEGTHYNVSYDETTGIPTVTVLTKMAELVAPEGTVTMTVTAKASDSVKDSVALTLTRAASAVNTISAADGNIIVPEDGVDGAATKTFTAKDQYGLDMDENTLAWSVEGSPEGIFVVAGVVSVTNAAKTAVKDGTKTYIVKANDATAEFTVALAELEVSAVKLENDTKVEMSIPGDGKPVETYTAKGVTIYDQYGQAMSDKSVEWSITPATAGVSIDKTTGVVTVSNTAKEAIATSADYTVTATAAEGVTAYYTVTVKRATATASSIKFDATCERFIAIPQTDPVSKTYSATVYDQYGDEFKISGEVVKATVEPDGTYSGDISVTGSTIKVESTASGTTTVKLKATYSSLDPVSFYVTVSQLLADWDKAGVTISKGTYGDTIEELVKAEGTTLDYGYSSGKYDKTLTGKFEVTGAYLKDDSTPVSVDETVNAGTYVVTVTFTGSNGEYNSIALTHEYEVTIAPKSIADAIVSVSEKYTYGGNEKTPIPTVTLIGYEEVTFNVIGYEDNTNAGTAKVEVEGTGNFKDKKSGEFIIASKPVSVSKIDGIDKTYDGTAAINKSDVSVTVDGFVSDKEATVTVDSASYDSTYDVGAQPAIVKVSLTGENAGNYCFEDGTKSCEYKTTGNITKADAPEVKGYKLTVYYRDNTDKTVDAADFGITEGEDGWKEVVLTSDFSGTVISSVTANSDGTLTLTPTASAAAEATDEITVTINSKNYEGTTAKITVKAVDISIPWPAEPTIKEAPVYGDTNANIISGFESRVEAETDVKIPGTITVKDADATPDADTTAVTLVFTPDNGYGFDGQTFEHSYDIDAVKPATITVTPDDGQSKVYGEDDPDEFTYTVSGAKNGEEVKISGKLEREPGYTVGTYGYSVAGMTLEENGAFKPSNYTLEVASGVMFTIEPKPVDIYVTVEDATYAAEEVYPEVYVVYFNGTEEVTLGKDDYELTWKNNINAGEDTASVTVKGKGNYSTENPKTEYFTIKPYKVDITWEQTEFYYTGKAPEFAGTYTKLEKDNIKYGKTSYDDVKVVEPESDFGTHTLDVVMTEDSNYVGEITYTINQVVFDTAEEGKIESSLSGRTRVGQELTAVITMNGVDVTDDFDIVWYAVDEDSEDGTGTELVEGSTLELTNDHKGMQVYYVATSKDRNIVLEEELQSDPSDKITKRKSSDSIRRDEEEEIVVRVEDLNAAQRENFTNLLFTYGPYADIKLGFSDVAASAWYYDYVTDMANAGVINGYPDGTFRPEGDVTWGETLKLVMKAVGYPDIPAVDSHWASGYMATAIADLLISGEVDLDAAITREDVANLTAQALKLAPAGIEYPFEDNAPEAAVALYAAGIITGSLDNGQLLFRAESTITRAEMAAIIYRVYNAK